MRTVRLACLFAAAAAAGAASETVHVCFRNGVQIGGLTLAVTMNALEVYEKQLGANIRYGCKQPGAVEITFRALPPISAPANALGAALVREGRVQPQIEIFRQAVRHYFPAADPLAEGRALAAIAAHELGHYLKQRTSHAPHGLHAAFLNVRQ
jgi:hypothetical protein